MTAGDRVVQLVAKVVVAGAHDEPEGQREQRQPARPGHGQTLHSRTGRVTGADVVPTMRSPVGGPMVHSRRRDGKESRHGRICASALDLERWSPRSPPRALDAADAGEVPGPRAADGQAPRRRRRHPRRGPGALSRPVPRSPGRAEQRDVAALRRDRRRHGRRGAAGAATARAGRRRHRGRGALPQHAGGAAPLARHDRRRRVPRRPSAPTTTGWARSTVRSRATASSASASSRGPTSTTPSPSWSTAPGSA